MGSLRNVVRQEVAGRQLAAVLGDRTGRALDVGAGQGTQALALARAGWVVDALDPDPAMRMACEQARAREPTDVAARVRVWSGGLDDLATAGGGPPGLALTHDLVLCHGVLMYLAAAEPAVATLAARVAPGGHVSILTRNAAALPFRPARRGDVDGALAALDEAAVAAARGRDVTYTNELGSTCRADDVDHLAGLLADHGFVGLQWFGVRLAVDGADPATPAPTDPAKLAAVLEVEERLGATDPFRALAPLFHLVGRRP